MAEYIPEWQKRLPRDLIPAIKALRESFDDAHYKCGKVSEVFCFSLLHDAAAEQAEEYLSPLMQLKAIIGPLACESFNQLLYEGTPSAIFKAFYELYLDCLKIQVRAIFLNLAAIGRANEPMVGVPHLEWAYSCTKELISSEKQCIRIWVRNVCDERVHDPDEDDEEGIFWRKWQAPMFLTMKPLRYQPYDAAAAWCRKDAEASSKLLDHFEDDYTLRLEMELDRVHGSEVVKLAKQPRPPVPTSEAEVNAANAIPTESRQARNVSILREAKKLSTKKKHQAWQKQYKALLKSHPGRSDVWYSQKIAKSDAGMNSNPETIRRKMK